MSKDSNEQFDAQEKGKVDESSKSMLAEVFEELLKPSRQAKNEINLVKPQTLPDIELTDEHKRNKLETSAGKLEKMMQKLVTAEDLAANLDKMFGINSGADLIELLNKSKRIEDQDIRRPGSQTAADKMTQDILTLLADSPSGTASVDILSYFQQHEGRKLPAERTGYNPNAAAGEDWQFKITARVGNTDLPVSDGINVVGEAAKHSTSFGSLIQELARMAAKEVTKKSDGPTEAPAGEKGMSPELYQAFIRAEAEKLQSKPGEAKPGEKPSDSKPADQKPAGQKPADQQPSDQKPSDSKPGDKPSSTPNPDAPHYQTMTEAESFAALLNMMQRKGVGDPVTEQRSRQGKGDLQRQINRVAHPNPDQAGGEGWIGPDVSDQGGPGRVVDVTKGGQR